MQDDSNHNSSLGCSVHKPLGELLSEAGLISAQQIEVALRDQASNPEMRIGEILALRGWVKQETADFFVEQWSSLANQQTKQPLVYYFYQAALLDEEQIEIIFHEQKHGSQKIRFHRLAVQKGWIKQQTVEFFLANLLASAIAKKSLKKSPFATPYELLKNYTSGKTDFQRSQFKKIQLNYVTLKGVNLDSSNLVEAELRQANFNNSTFRQANLSRANLEKALLKNTDFQSACLNQANLTDAHLEGSSFKEANLAGADLRDAYFVNVSLQGADLRNTKLQGTNFQGAYYSSKTYFDLNFDPLKAGMELV